MTALNLGELPDEVQSLQHVYVPSELDSDLGYLGSACSLTRSAVIQALVVDKFRSAADPFPSPIEQLLSRAYLPEICRVSSCEASGDTVLRTPHLPMSIYDKFKAAAHARGLTKSDYMRVLIVEGLQHYAALVAKMSAPAHL